MPFIEFSINPKTRLASISIPCQPRNEVAWCLKSVMDGMIWYQMPEGWGVYLANLDQALTRWTGNQALLQWFLDSPGTCDDRDNWNRSSARALFGALMGFSNPNGHTQSEQCLCEVDTFRKDLWKLTGICCMWSLSLGSLHFNFEMIKWTHIKHSQRVDPYFRLARVFQTKPVQPHAQEFPYASSNPSHI